MSVLKVNMTFRNSAVYATAPDMVLKLNRYNSRGRCPMCQNLYIATGAAIPNNPSPILSCNCTAATSDKRDCRTASSSTKIT